MLDRRGLRGRYNFFYLPIDLKRFAYRGKKTNANKGYAFINLRDPEDSDLLHELLHERQFWAQAQWTLRRETKGSKLVTK